MALFFFFSSLICYKLLLLLYLIIFSLRYLSTYVCMVYIYYFFFFLFFFVSFRELLLLLFLYIYTVSVECHGYRVGIYIYRYIGWNAESGNYSRLEDHQLTRVLGYLFIYLPFSIDTRGAETFDASYRFLTLCPWKRFSSFSLYRK